jgi:hypothetical protein
VKIGSSLFQVELLLKKGYLTRKTAVTAGAEGTS